MRDRKGYRSIAFLVLASLAIVGEAAEQPGVASTKEENEANGKGAERSLEAVAGSAAEAKGSGRREGLGEIQDEVIVTGTHIRGSQPASPIFVYDREDFDRAGAATAEQFLATIPQNFTGGASQDTFTDPFGEVNPSFASGVNLRGLGSSSTLVLVDGKRSAAAGLAEFVDVSMIPLSAVERIEIMTDGASAIYGADAIGGVVNFIMRRDYEGAETKGRYGAPTSGGAEEAQASQSFGANWNTGGMLLAADYYRRSSLSTLDRRFSRETIAPLDGPRDLVPEQERISGYLSAQQELGRKARLSASLMYSDRSAFYTDWQTIEVPEEASTQQSSASLGAVYDIGRSWHLDVSGGISRNEIVSRQTTSGRTITNPSEYFLWSADARTGGDLFEFPAGPVKLAIGGSYRDESFETSVIGPTGVLTPPSEKRYSSKAASGEIVVPVFGKAGGGAGLMLTVAGRYEEYSSFGSTFDPKYGIRWAPVEDFAFRATYGTSFKAPNAWQLSEGPTGRNLTNLVDPTSPTGRTRTLVRQGRNASLQPETAATMTAGIEWSPSFVSGLRTELTYFDIDYADRISGFTVTSAMQLNDPVYATTVLRRGDIPDADFNALIVQLFGTAPVVGCVPPNPGGPCSEPPGNVRAILDRRLTNIAVSHTSGIDWSLSQHMGTHIGAFDFEVNASYLLANARQVSDVAPEIVTLNRVGSPVDLRVRGGVIWSASGWSLATYLNYTDNYDNDGALNLGTRAPLPRAEIDSWTTVDVNVSYSSGQRSSHWLSDVRLSLSVLNAFDEDPPSYDDGGFGLGYDPSNADPLGRFISFTISKGW